MYAANWDYKPNTSDSNIYNISRKIFMPETKKETKVEQFNTRRHELLTKLMPLIYLLKLCGSFAISRSNEGKFYFRWLSWTNIYTYTIYVPLTVLTAVIWVEMVKQTSSLTNPQHVAFHMCSLLLMLLHLLPICFILDAQRFAHFFNQWQVTQDNYERTSGKQLHLPMKRYLNVSFLLIIVMTAFVCFDVTKNHSIIVERYQFENRYTPFYRYISIYHMLLITTGGCLWFLLNTALRQWGHQILEDLQSWRNMECIKIRQYSMVWAQLRDLITFLSRGLQLGGLCFMICQFCINVTSIYNFTVTISQGHGINTHFGVAVLCVLLLTLVSECAHGTVEKIGTEFQDFLMECRAERSITSEMDVELKRFYDFTVTHPPVINLAGFVTLNRNLNVSIFANYITYVVIFFQMGSSGSCPSSDEKANV